MPTPETIERAVREFLDENFPLGDGLTLSRSDSLQDAGVIDFIGVLELIGFSSSATASKSPMPRCCRRTSTRLTA